MDLPTLMLGVALLSGLYLATNIGANEVANLLGTAVGSKALDLRRALVVAGLFELAGVMLGSREVSTTVGARLVDLRGEPGALLLAAGLAAVLLVTAVTLHVATMRDAPMSSAHALVGSMLGFGVVMGGPMAISWPVVLGILAAWLLSPLFAGLLGFTLFRQLQRYVLDRPRPDRAITRLGPVLVIPLVGAVAFTTMRSGYLPTSVDGSMAAWIAFAVGGAAAIVSIPLFVRTERTQRAENGERFAAAERVFLGLQALTACVLVFAHGSNEIALVIGPIAAIVSALRFGPEDVLAISTDVVVLGAVGAVIGITSQGQRALTATGGDLAQLAPSRGFIAELSAIITLLVATHLGIPISATHTLIGAVLGVALARSIGALDLKIVRATAMGLVVTVPITALTTVAVFGALRLLLGI